MQAADALALPRGILVANPLPEGAQLDPALHDRLLAAALDAADSASVRGKEITPFLFEYIHEHTERTSVAVNLEIVRGNCRLAAEIARSWSALQAEDRRAQLVAPTTSGRSGTEPAVAADDLQVDGHARGPVCWWM